MAEETVTKSAPETDGELKTWKRRGLLAAAWAAVAAIVAKQTTQPVEASTAALLANTETAGVTQFVTGPSSIKVSIGTYTSAQSVLIASAYGASGANAALHGTQIPPGTAAPERCGVYGEGWIFGTGVLGTAASTNVAVHGIATDSGIGVWGDSTSNIGVLGTIPAASAANAIAIYGLNNSSYAGPGPGAGGFGVYGLSAKGHGLVGATATAGAGAVVGATNGVAGAYAGVFYGPAIVGGDFTVFGAKSAAVPHPDGSHRRLYCVESPESWFEDFGKGTLECGQADVTIDPDFAAVVDLDDYHVFLTPYGGLDVLAVTAQTPLGFRVETKDPTSVTRFSWRVVAKRKDIVGERLATVTIPPEPQLPTPGPRSTHAQSSGSGSPAVVGALFNRVRVDMKKRKPSVPFILVLGIAICCVLMGFVPAEAAPTFTVNATFDAIDANAGDGVCATSGGMCTLRAAIMEANHTPGGGATIILPGGTYTLTIVTPSLTDDETTGDLDITANMSLVGAGSSTAVIDGNGSVVGIDGVFEIHSGAIASISGVTVRNGNVRSNFRNGEGGGILNDGTLTLTNSTVSGSSAPNAGGGIFNAGTLTLTSSTVSGNNGTSGGGIFSGGTLVLINSTVSGNHALLGGGIVNSGGALILNNSTVSSNSASGQGGGIYNSGALTMLNTTVSGNSAIGNGSAGGGIFHLTGTLTLLFNNTVSGNSTSGSGGGINNGQPPFTGTVNILNSTITGNTAGVPKAAGVGGGVSTGNLSTTTFQNTILARNLAVTNLIGGFPVLDFDDCAGTMVSDGHNLMGVQNCTVTGAAPLLGDAQLGPLMYNGGPTETHALAASSPAIDAGDCTLGQKPDRDQRGFPRNVDGNGDLVVKCDIGAYEFGAGSRGPGDFDSDGKSDILWRHDSGAVAIWLMNALTIQSMAAIGAPGNDWHIADTGDFNGDGTSDILWRHDSGAVAIWLMDGVTIQSMAVVGAPGLDWHIADTGDFNGDGRSDILWRHDSGAVAIWLMNGMTIQSMAVVGAPGLDWHIADTGDFNGDGKSDILWRHDSGTVAIWLMNGVTVQSMTAIGAPGNDWHIADTGDFNGDGKSDILWRHDSGAVAIWLMNGVTIQSMAVVGAPGNDWHIADAGDFNGDGRSDILWRHDSGVVAIWLMNGVTIQSMAAVGAPGNDWHVASN